MFVAFQKQSMIGVIPVIWNSLIIINIVIQGLNLLPRSSNDPLWDRQKCNDERSCCVLLLICLGISRL